MSARLFKVHYKVCARAFETIQSSFSTRLVLARNMGSYCVAHIYCA
jgi:hypothetical protein